MTADSPSAAARPRESVLRFDLAVQKGHLFVYTAALLTALAGWALGVFPLVVTVAFTAWLVACSSALIFYVLLKRGVDRRILNPLWMLVDIAFVTLGVYVSGGVRSPWFVWYVATAYTASFVMGKRVAYVVGGANTVIYMATLFAMGQARFFNEAFYLGLTHMILLFGASYFFLAGIANLQEKRLRIRQLEAVEKSKVEELTRLTEELTRKTEELAEANRRIREADRLKTQFVANMSHELRTPLNSIIGFSELLVERLDGKIDPRQLGFLRHVVSAGQHLLAMINDVLDLTKIEAGKMDFYPEYFHVAPVVESICTVMRGAAKSSLVFVIDIPDDLPTIESDLARFKQILINLLSNAVKFSPPGGPVTISARFIDNEGSITVSVADKGLGIDSKDYDVIFQEFRQIDGTSRRAFGGTGLGLALVKKFVEMQHGTVRVESAPGEGSVFSFTLPVRASSVCAERAEGDDAASHEGNTILVVEDDGEAYDVIASTLRSAGYITVRARHVEEAIRLAREARPLAMTLDLILPTLDGWDALKRMKSDAGTRDIPVVIISMIENRDLGMALGAEDYFVKPFDRDQLVDRIHVIAARASRPRPRLLLIDDDLSVHSLLDEELSPLGYDLKSASNGEEGLRAARVSAPDVILLDLLMPGMSGFEVAEQLKDDPKTAAIPIVVLTSKDVSDAERSELQSKVSGLIQKGKSAREQLLRELKILERKRAAPAQ